MEKHMKSKMLKFLLIIASVVMTAWAPQVQAAPLVWNLTDVTFDDGGIATGSIEYDNVTSSMIDWDITVSGGNTTTFPVFTYSPTTSTYVNLATSYPEGTFLFEQNSSIRQLRMTPLADLDGTGTVALLLGAVSALGGEECYNCSPFRLITDGDLAPIPEPATMLLLGSGLVGLAGFRRKFRRE